MKFEESIRIQPSNQRTAKNTNDIPFKISKQASVGKDQISKNWRLFESMCASCVQHVYVKTSVEYSISAVFFSPLFPVPSGHSFGGPAIPTSSPTLEFFGSCEHLHENTTAEPACGGQRTACRSSTTTECFECVCESKSKNRSRTQMTSSSKFEYCTAELILQMFQFQAQKHSNDVLGLNSRYASNL